RLADVEQPRSGTSKDGDDLSWDVVQERRDRVPGIDHRVLYVSQMGDKKPERGHLEYADHNSHGRLDKADHEPKYGIHHIPEAGDVGIEQDEGSDQRRDRNDDDPDRVG